MLTITIVLLVVLFILYKLLLVVPMREIHVIERLGKFRAVLEPGFHLLVPFIDKVAYIHDSREQVFDVPAQVCISKDNINRKSL